MSCIGFSCPDLAELPQGNCHAIHLNLNCKMSFPEACLLTISSDMFTGCFACIHETILSLQSCQQKVCSRSYSVAATQLSLQDPVVSIPLSLHGNICVLLIHAELVSYTFYFAHALQCQAEAAHVQSDIVLCPLQHSIL